MEKNNIEQKDIEKKNKTIMIILIIFIVLTLILSGHIVYDKLFKNDNNSSENQNEIPKKNTLTTQVPEVKLPEWANYVLNQNISSITYEGYGTNDKCIKKEATREQLKDILIHMTKGKLSKFESLGAGGTCNHGITIEYGEKQLDIANGKWIWINDNDPEVIKLLEKEEYTYIEPGNDSSWIVYEYDWDTSYMDDLFK